MITALLRPIALASLLATLPASAQDAPTVAAPAVPAADGGMPPPPQWDPPPLEPFVATYQAFYKGREAGDATLRVTHEQGSRWQVDMAVRGRRGFAGILGLNLEQSTVFDNQETVYVPLSQSTVKKALFLGKKVTGTYNWQEHVAQWQGDLKKDRRRPIALQRGDQSALLLNLSLMRDARPGQPLRYRFVDVGRVRQYEYQAADATEIVQAGDLSYDALRVYRTNGGNDETILWIANGVPTPVRILQREDGEDAIDLRLIEYQGA
ncbi:DUF3108 domain-containing protein [Stenotrophomonas mori]|uniref:DUF3108 domain-containing protein n=1 Tax=Stenotrophomonas mori TaxID=2871096 RepID=A0ABT0SCI6_9GAMM|nr:DUF3108 domain-containing protein [Stenotrophomonas mori]MCL7713048.1 DUF3108 domain-containing protein [Stenotrophomonas mori]